MKQLIEILSVLVLAAILLPLIAAAFCTWRRRGLGLAANITTGTHEDGVLSKRADAAIATRHLLVKIGSDANHVAVTAGVTDIPLGVCPDEPEAAEDLAAVQLLGVKKGTLKMVANAEVTVGALVTVGAAGGKVAPLPAAAGSYWIVGRALTAASGDGVAFEVQHCFPTLRVVEA